MSMRSLYKSGGQRCAPARPSFLAYTRGSHRADLAGNRRSVAFRFGLLLLRTLGVMLMTVTMLMLPALSAAQENPFPNAASVVQPQTYVSIQPVPRGSAFEVAIVGKISPGFHVNAHEPSEEYLIPTKVTAELPPGVVLVETTYPRGVMRGFRFTKTQLRVYEGSFTVRMKFRAGSSAAMGRQKLALTLGYQACNQDACLPPTKVPATTQIEIASADTPAQRSTDPVFSSAPAMKFPAMKH